MLLSRVTAGLPGFDMDPGVRFAPRRHSLFLGLPACLMPAAATMLGLPQVLAECAAFVPALAAPILFVLSGVAAIFGLAALLGLAA